MMRSTGAELEIDLAAIVANWRDLCRRHPGGPVAGVVKADAYGLGAEFVAPALYAAGCRHFFAAHLQEAVAIRALVPDASVAVLNGLWPGDAPVYAEHGILPVLGSLPEIEAWSGPALLHVDTGMNRLGLSPAEGETLAAAPDLLRRGGGRWVITPPGSSEVGGGPLNQTQRRHFEDACARLPPAPKSLANSSALFLGPDYGSDLARPGAALYGINSTPDAPNPMRPVVRLRARILQVRDVPAGDGVGYNATW